ncbi:MAG: hypothetical protein ACFFD7_12610 [Candidatus Thorarchaeota archaeon]
MKRSIIPKISIPLIIAIVFFSCTSIVYAASDNSKITFRPLSDWKENNPSIFYGWRGSPSGQESPLYQIDMAEWWTGTPPPKGTWDGYIKERELSDGRAQVTVYLSLHNAPFWLIIDGTPILDQIFEEGRTLEIYHEVNKFIIESPGAIIPNLFDIDLLDFICSFGSGWGSGMFTEYAEAYGFTPGAIGIVNINQRGLIFPALQNGFQGALADVFPVEFINVHEVC